MNEHGLFLINFINLIKCIQKLFAVCKKLESNYSTLEFLFFD